MSGPGSTEQQDFGNPAAFFNNGPQQGGSGQDFFNQHHQGAPQQQNWYQQQSSPEDMPGNPQPPASAPMFYNPADYAKGAVTQPSVFNPYPQADATQQPPPSEMNQQLHGENYPNSGNQWYQQEKTETHPPHSQGWDHPQEDQNYIYGEANTHELMPGHGHTADSYGQQPYYPQQPNDSLVSGQAMQGNGDHVPPNQWDQQPTSVAGEQEAGWNNPNLVSQLQNNVPLGDISKSNESANQESKQDKVGQPIVEDDDSGSGYLGFFHNADNESDFAESDKNESAEDSSHQEPRTMAPRTCDENKAPDSQQFPPSIPVGGQVPTMQQNHPVSQHFQPGQELPPMNQSEIPPTFHPPNGQHDGGSSASGNYPGMLSEVGEEGRTGNYPERGGSDIDNVQQPFQQDTLEGPYLQNQFPPPQTNSQDGFDTRQAPEVELQTSDGGSEIEPPSEHSSITGSLPPSDPSASSSTSRSNSLLGEAGGSAVPSTGISTSASHENFPVESSKEIVMQEQRENAAASGGESLSHVVLNNQGEISESTEVTSPQLQLTGSIPGPGQNAQMTPVSNAPVGYPSPYLHGDVPPTDISRQNSAVSEISNVSVPSTTDTDLSRTGSLKAEPEQQFNQAAIGAIQNNPSEPVTSGGTHVPHPLPHPPPPSTQTVTGHQNHEKSVLKQDIPQIPHVTQSNVHTLPGHGNMSQPSQSSGLKPGELPPPAPNPSNPQPSLANPLSQSSSAPANSTVSTPPVHSQPQGSRSTNPLLETNPLLSGASHPSAFRSVRGHQSQPPVPATVNPSPPLWSTEVPPLPSNILLAPAAAPSSRGLALTTPSQPTQPIKLDSNLAATIANVNVPPPPTEAAALLEQSSRTTAKTQGQVVPNQAVPSSGGQTVPSVDQVTQSMSGLTVGQIPQPTLLPPASTVSAAAQQSVTGAPVGNTPQVPVNAVQSLPSLGQSTAQGQIALAASSSAPAIANQSNPVKTVQPVPLLAGAQYQPQAPSTSAVQNTSQYQQQQQPGTTQSQQYAPNQQQMPPGQEQWYGHAGQYSYGQHPYQYYHQDYRSQYNYDQYYRQYPKGSYYRDQQRPYSRQGYEQDRYRERDPMRSYSRQGYEQERPRSRQGKGYEYGYDAYYKGYNRRDQRQRDYGDYEEYNRKRGYRGNDQRYDEWYRSQDYYQQSANRSRGYDQNTSGLDQSRNDSQEQEGNQSKDAADRRQESFSSEFHHTGGDTPERYGANQSSIPAPGYGDYGDQYGSRGYDYAGHRDSRGSYDNGYGSTDGTWNQYQYGYDPSYSQQAKPATPSPPERLTPCKFNRPHMVARFSSGGHLIKVMPNLPTEGQPATVEIHSVEEMLEHNEEYKELKAFPGPLVRNDTHKNDVVRFAIQKAADCRKSTGITDKESAALLWDLMVLLCRQNGTIVGTDISELLLQGHPMTNKIEAAPSQPVTAIGHGDAANDEEGEAAAVQETQIVEQQLKKSTGPDIEKETHRFRELLLFGRKKEALDSAVRGGLWGHALLLACKMDHRTHLSVMTRFANSLPMNDPLQTLYQLMSNRQPAAVTSCADEKWGDWRPHLSMILSNLISNTDLDVKSITTLGDSLASRGLLYASHFCYLMAQIGMGHYSKKTTKMVLLGASHSLPFKEFARLTPIQQTEVYEYAQSLANKRYSLPTFQVYKLIYATHLLDYGLVSQALHYCEVITNTIQYSPAYYNLALIDKVSEFSHRLKYHDPQYFDGREVTEPEWLKDLDHIKIQFEEGAIRPSSTNNTPMPWVESYSNLSTMGDSVTSEGLSFEVSRTGVPGGQPRMDTPQSDEYRMGGSVDGQQEQQYGTGQQEQGQEGFGGGQQVQDQMQGGAGGGFSMDPSGYYQPTDGTNADYPAVQTPQQSTSGFDWGTQQQYPEVGTEANQQQQMSGNYTHFGTQPSDKTKPPNLDLGASAASTLSEYSTTSAASATTGESPTDTDLVDSGASQAFDYYGMSTNMGNQGNGYPGYGSDQPGGPPSPVKTMTPPDTPMSRTRTRTLSGDSNQMTPTPQPQQKVQQKPEKPKEKDAKPQKKGGWFSGWFNKGNKEMHLPDDKDKTIQWDEKKKKWVNTAGDEDDSSGPPPPPPTDHELSGGPAPPATSAASGPPGAGPPAGAPPGANKFSRKFGRGNYVDIFNQGSTMPAKSSSLPPPSKIFDTLPATNAMPTNFFVPQGGVDLADEAGGGQPQVGNPESRSQTPASQRSRQNSGAQTQANEPPQFFNPNAFGSSTGSSNFPGMDSGRHQEQTQPPQQIQQVQQEENLSRSSSMSSLSQEVSQHMKNQQQDGQSGWTQEEQSTAAPPPGPAPVTQPMMFNPQQFSQPSFPPQQTPRRGYGARRQYPNQR